jgi:hypothetical protein
MSSTEAIQRAAVSALQVELPTASVTASTPHPYVGEECRKDDLDMTVGEDARSLNLKVARILTEVVAATWEVHRLREVLPMTLRMSDYSENPVTQKRPIHV